MNFVYSIIVNYHFPLDRLDVYILYLKLAEGPRGGGAMPGCPPWLRHCQSALFIIRIMSIESLIDHEVCSSLRFFLSGSRSVLLISSLFEWAFADLSCLHKINKSEAKSHQQPQPVFSAGSRAQLFTGAHINTAEIEAYPIVCFSYKNTVLPRLVRPT